MLLTHTQPYTHTVCIPIYPLHIYTHTMYAYLYVVLCMHTEILNVKNA